MINKNEQMIDATCFMLFEKEREREREKKGIKLSDNARRWRLTKVYSYN